VYSWYWELGAPRCAVPARLAYFFTRFFFWRLNGRSGTEIFFIGGRRLKNKKMALVLIEFSGVSLHGEKKTKQKIFPPKNLEKSQKNLGR
jgi:hypothetical protein